MNTGDPVLVRARWGKPVLLLFVAETEGFFYACTDEEMRKAFRRKRGPQGLRYKKEDGYRPDDVLYRILDDAYQDGDQALLNYVWRCGIAAFGPNLAERRAS